MVENTKNMEMGISIEGYPTLRLIDTRDDTVEEERKLKNEIQTDYLNRIMSSGAIPLSNDIMYNCYLGDDGTPATNTDNGLLGSNLGNTVSREQIISYDNRETGKMEVYDTEKFDFNNIFHASAFNPNDPIEGKIAVFDADTDKITYFNILNDEFIVEFDLSGYTIHYLTFSRDGNYLAAYASSGDIFIYDMLDFTLNITISDAEGASSHIRGLDWGPENTTLVYSTGSILKAVDVVDGSLVKEFDSNWGYVNKRFAISNDGRYIIVASGNEFKILEYSSENVIVTEYKSDAIRDVGWGMNDRYAIVFYYDYVSYRNYEYGSYLYDMDTLEFNKLISGTTEYKETYGNNFRVSPDSRFLGYTYVEGGYMIYGSRTRRITNYTFGNMENKSGGRFDTDGYNGIYPIKKSMAINEYYFYDGSHLRIIKGRNPAPERSIGYRWTFEPGEGTGEIKEIALRTNDDSYFNNNWVARQAVAPSIIKEDYHKLEVEWKIIIRNDSYNTSGTIVDGGRNLEDIEWNSYFGNMSFHEVVRGNILRKYITKDDIRVIVGDNNESSSYNEDLVMKGEYRNHASPPFFMEVDSYVQDSFERSFRIGFDVTQCNLEFNDGVDKYSIGELVLADTDSWNMSNYGLVNGISRFTFNPKLDKVNSFRLYFDFTFKINVGSE